VHLKHKHTSALKGCVTKMQT